MADVVVVVMVMVMVEGEGQTPRPETQKNSGKEENTKEFKQKLEKTDQAAGIRDALKNPPFGSRTLCSQKEKSGAHQPRRTSEACSASEKRRRLSEALRTFWGFRTPKSEERALSGIKVGENGNSFRIGKVYRPHMGVAGGNGLFHFYTFTDLGLGGLHQ